MTDRQSMRWGLYIQERGRGGGGAGAERLVWGSDRQAVYEMGALQTGRGNWGVVYRLLRGS